MIITIDGPAGTGKSSVARRVAAHFGMDYVDTGAIYRTITWAILEQKIDLADGEKLGALIEHFPQQFRVHDGQFFWGSVDITGAIRTADVTAFVSEVSALESVRTPILFLQRAIVKEMALDAVLEGRDMGSVVFPNADLKFYLSATPEVRALRRYSELKRKGQLAGVTKKKVLSDLQRRDEFDSGRALAPLCKPERAIEVDTSHLTEDKVVAQLISKIQAILDGAAKKRLYNLKNTGLFAYTVRVIIISWLKVFYRLKARGAENIPSGGAIFAATHASFIDPPLVAACSPYITYFLARKTLFKNPLFGALIRKLFAYPVDQQRSSSELFKTVKELTKEGHKILIFPEGARTPDGEIQEAKRGVGLMASIARVPLIPVYVDGTYAVWSKSRKWPKLFGKTVCIFGKPLSFKDYAHLPQKEAVEAITKDWYKAVVSLKKKHIKEVKES